MIDIDRIKIEISTGKKKEKLIIVSTAAMGLTYPGLEPTAHTLLILWV